MYAISEYSTEDMGCWLMAVPRSYTIGTKHDVCDNNISIALNRDRVRLKMWPRETISLHFHLSFQRVLHDRLELADFTNTTQNIHTTDSITPCADK